MKKVITFSLWGTNNTYNIGAIKNAIIAKEKYPNFECWFYIHTETVPQNIIDKLKILSNVHIIPKSGNLNTVKPMMWRFEAIDDPNVEIMMPRDTDTRILDREVQAVNDWLNSNTLFHIMRDHPHHKMKILGGMFGTKKLSNLNWKIEIDKIIQKSHRNYDISFLEQIIYNRIKDNCVIHASFHKYEKNCKNFPSPFIDYHHVGEYVFENDTRSASHIKALKKNII